MKPGEQATNKAAATDGTRTPGPPTAAARAAAQAYGRNALQAPPAPAAGQPPAGLEPATPDRDELITDCLPLVKFIAHRISARLPAHVEVDDLIHSGILGLMDAVKKFEPDRNVKFKTYAEQRIRGAILDGLRDLDWVPRSLRRKKKDIETAYRELEQRRGRAATDEEVAAHLGMPLEELQRSLDDLKGVTLGTFLDAGENGEGENLISFVPDPDGENPHILLQTREVRTILKNAVEKLPAKERVVVELYYYDELTMKEIGAVLNITESRVSQLHTKSMLRLRGKLRERRIEG
jgi:RNA polymerase sigma factor FliA